MNQLATLSLLLFSATYCYAADGEWSAWGPCDGSWSKSTLKKGWSIHSKFKSCTIFNPEGGEPKTTAEKDCLARHNELRARLGKEPLIWDSKIQASAQEWANHIADLGKLEHTSNGKYGENLAMNSISVDLGANAVDLWYKEICDYKSNCGFTHGTGHFTQVVWGESKYVGCAVAKGSNGYYTVGQYAPAGNMVSPGEFERNVGCPDSALIKENQGKTCSRRDAFTRLFRDEVKAVLDEMKMEDEKKTGKTIEILKR